MKKIKDKEFYIKIQRKREKHNLKRKLKGKKKQKQIRQLLQNKDENTRKNLVKIIGEYGDNRVKAPKNFSLLKNTEETIKLLQRKILVVQRPIL